MTTARRRSLFATVLIVLLGASGIVVVGSGTSSGATKLNPACTRGADSTGPTDGPGAFTAASRGGGQGQAEISGAGNNPAWEGTLSWDLEQVVTGNNGPTQTPGPGTLEGRLFFTLSGAEAGPIRFTSDCIQEAGVFNKVETEDDPVAPETNRRVKRGIEGEWEGTISNFPHKGDETHVIAAIAVWTAQGVKDPRFHLDVTSVNDVGPGCLDEVAPDLSVGGPTQNGRSKATVDAPNKQAGRGSCVNFAEENFED